MINAKQARKEATEILNRRNIVARHRLEEKLFYALEREMNSKIADGEYELHSYYHEEFNEVVDSVLKRVRSFGYKCKLIGKNPTKNGYPPHTIEVKISW